VERITIEGNLTGEGNNATGISVVNATRLRLPCTIAFPNGVAIDWGTGHPDVYEYPQVLSGSVSGERPRTRTQHQPIDLFMYLSAQGTPAISIRNVNSDVNASSDIQLATPDGLYSFIRRVVDRLVLGSRDQADSKWERFALDPTKGIIWDDVDQSVAVGTRIYVDDYGGNFANFTPPTGYEGIIILVRDTNSSNPGTRLYAYINGAWHYVDLS